MLDFQFEVLTTHLNDGGKDPQRSSVNNAHAYLGAPYGIYATADGYLALAMGSIITLAQLLECPALTAFADPQSWFRQRDTIKSILVDHLQTRPTADWLARLEPADYWCADVLTWRQLLDHDAFKVLDMVQTVQRPNGAQLQTTRCPIRIDGQRLKAAKGAPTIGADNATIRHDFDLPN